MINMNKFAREVARREGGKKQVDIAQIKQIIRIVFQVLAEMGAPKKKK